MGNVWLGPDPLGDGSVPVSFTGYVDHDRALREMSAASALLFYAPANTRATSGKIFEYLTSGRPVLAVAQPTTSPPSSSTSSAPERSPPPTTRPQ